MKSVTIGRNAGRLLLAPSLNPYPESSPHYAEWESGWRDATREELLRRDAERRQRAGTLAASGCTELGT